MTPTTRQCLSAMSLLLLLACNARDALGGSPDRPTGLSIDALSETVWIEDFSVSADGRTVAFKSAEAGTYDIWTVPVAGGKPTRLTSLPGREMNPRFSPDGQWIAFEADNGGTDTRDIYVVSSTGGTPIRLTDHPLDDANPIWTRDSKSIYFTTEMNGGFDLARIDLATKRITRVGKGADDLQLSPDGAWFAYVGNEATDDDNESNSDIYIMAANGGAPRLLTQKAGRSLNVAPRWSPDGKSIAFISDRDGFSNLGVIDVATGATTMLLTEPVEHSEPRWSPDGKWISFTKNLNYNYHIFKIRASGGTAQQLTHVDGVNGGSTATGQTRSDHAWLPQGEIVFYHSDPTTTGDLWVMSDAGGQGRRITNHQSVTLRDPSHFVWPDFIEYPSFDGLKVAGMVYRPKGSKAGDKLPALLFLRANSNGQHPAQWHPFIQYFTSRGYLVFAPNFRGSTGRGRVYRQAVFTRGGEDDVHDAFVGLDRLAEQGWIDPQRVGVFGGSTGGFFTTASITKDPQRFKAGIVWYGATDLVTLSSYSALESWCRFLIGKTPLENPEAYYKRSIVYHAAEAKVPLLFLYAQGDRGARFQQIEQYGVQAAIHGNWYDWVEYGGEPHGWYHWKPDTIRKSLRIMSDMFDTFVLGEQHDVKKTAVEQRNGTTPLRNPDIEWANSIAHGGSPQ